MQFKQQAGKSNYVTPNTTIADFYEKDLLVMIRPWNNSDHSKVVIEEITQYLSATQADLDLTTPFQFLEGVSTLANRVRISALLANDRLFKAENREFYSCGFEMAILYKKHDELAWLYIGGFEIEAEYNHYKKIIAATGDSIDYNNFLPPYLLGIDRNPMLQVGSLQVQNLQSITLKSSFNKNETIWTCEVTGFNVS